MASEVLKVNAKVKSIILSGNSIGADGAKVLAEVRVQMPMQM